VTDGLPALALVMDPATEDALHRPPRKPDEEILGRPEWTSIAWTGALQAAVTLSVFFWALKNRDILEARNLAFSVLVFGEVLRSFASRSRTKLFWEVGAFSNMRLVGVVIVSVAVQLAIHHMPFTRSLFEIGPLSLGDCLLSLAIGFIPVSVLEIGKLLRRLRPRLGGKGSQIISKPLEAGR
jgi:Ca2+-transporting ATPase